MELLASPLDNIFLHICKIDWTIVKQSTNIVGGHTGSKCRIVFCERGKHFNLLLLERKNLFFDRALRYHAIHHHILFLPDTVCTVNSLSFHGRVPPRVQQKYVIRFGQCQAETTSAK